MNFMERRSGYPFCCSIRFKGIIAEEYRKDMHCIFIFGNWHAGKDRIFEPVQYKPDYMKVAPFRELEYPVEWLGCDEPDHEWQNKYDIETGEFIFTCTIWDRLEFENFFVLTLPFIVSKVITCEIWEENEYVSRVSNRVGKIANYVLKDYKWQMVKNN